MISVVVPIHNEERSIELLYGELAAALDGAGAEWEAVFVDDGSNDGSFAALTRLHSAHPNVKVVRLRRNFGKAAALTSGFAQAEGEVIVTIDGDPRTIPRRSRACSPSSTRGSISSRAGRRAAATPGGGGRRRRSSTGSSGTCPASVSTT